MVDVRSVGDLWCWQCRTCGRLDRRWYRGYAQAVNAAQAHVSFAHTRVALSVAPP